MFETVFRPPNAILFIAIGVVVLGVLSLFFKKGEVGRKITSLVIVVLVAGGLLFVLYRPITLTVDTDGVRTSGINRMQVSWSEVTHAHEITNLPYSEFRPTVRKRGAAMGDYRSGRFLLSNDNEAWVLAERSDAAVVLVTDDLTYLLGPEDLSGLVEAINQFRTPPDTAPQ